VKYLILVWVLLLSGCQTIGGFFNIAADANDKALLSAEVTICRAASVGAVIRRYNTKEKAEAWKEFVVKVCTKSDEKVPLMFRN